MDTNKKKAALEELKSLWLLKNHGILGRQAAILSRDRAGQKQNLPNALSPPTGGCPMKFIAAFRWTKTKGKQLWSSCNPMGSCCEVVGLFPKTKSAHHVVAADWWISSKNHGCIPTDANQRKHALEWLQSLWLLQSCGIFELWATIPSMDRVGQKQNLPTTSSQPTGGSPTKIMDAFGQMPTKGNVIWNGCNPFGSCKLALAKS